MKGESAPYNPSYALSDKPDAGPVHRSDAAAFFCHAQALVEPEVAIGAGTRIWAFVHVLSGAQMGKDCNICDHVFIEHDVVIGDRVTVKCGVSLWDGMRIEDDVFIGPNACFTNDSRPRSKQYHQKLLPTVLKQGCTMGANSTTLPGLTIGEWAMVGAGAVVTRSVPDYGLVRGNPARLVGWVCRCGRGLPAASARRMACTCGLEYEHISDQEVRKLT